MKFSKTWEELKNLMLLKTLPLHYEETNGSYTVFLQEGSVMYITEIVKEEPATEEQLDFEVNHKDYANQPMEVRDSGNKKVVLNTSRPLGTDSYFTTTGDSDTDIGDGVALRWDFSNTDNVVEAPEGFKRKLIKIKFLDDIWLKDGTFYYFNGLKGSYGNVYFICPTGEYYKNNEGELVQAIEDTVFMKLINKFYFQGSVNVGDEINAEAAPSAPLPAGYELCIEITVPESDVESTGHIILEMFRERTVIL